MGRGKNIQVLCKEMADFIKNLIMIKVGVGDYSVLDILPGEYASYSEISQLFGLEYLKTAFAKFAEIELELKYSLNPENLFESACLGLISFNDENSIKVVSNQAKPEPVIQPVQQMNNVVMLDVESSPFKTEKVEDLTNQSAVEKIWGNVLIKVKEKNLFALSNALVNVTKVSQVGKNIIITTNDLGSFEMIDNKDRISVILKLVNLFDDSIENVIVEYDNKNASIQDDKDKLKDAFRSKIKFKE